MTNVDKKNVTFVKNALFILVMLASLCLVATPAKTTDMVTETSSTLVVVKPPIKTLVKEFNTILGDNIAPVRLYSEGKVLTAELDGNGDPLIINDNSDLEFVNEQVLASTGSYPDSYVISNAPYSVIENLRFSPQAPRGLNDAYENQHFPSITINSDNSLVRNCTFGPNSQTGLSSLVFVNGAANVTIYNNTLSGASSSSGEAYGIRITWGGSEGDFRSSNNVTVYNNTITSIVAQTVAYGISFKGSSDDQIGYAQDIHIFNNSIHTIESKTGFAVGIFGNETTNTSIENNIITGMNASQSYGILVHNTNPVTIQDNTLDGSVDLTFGQAVGIQTLNTTQTTIVENQITYFGSNCSLTAIKAVDTVGLNLTNNDFQGVEVLGRFRGFEISSSSQVTVKGNIVSHINADDNIIGLEVDGGSNLYIGVNTFSWFTSENGNVTGASIRGVANPIVENNTFDQITSTYTSFDFTKAKFAYGLIVNQSTNPTIRHSTIEQVVSNSKAYGLYLNNTPSALVQNLSIAGVTSKSSFGIAGLNAGSDVVVENSSVSNLLSLATESYGIYLSDGVEPLIRHNTISDVTSPSRLNGIYVIGGSEPTIEYNTINILTSTSPIYENTGIFVKDGGTTIISSNTLAMLSAEFANVNGIYLENGPGSNISLNTLSHLSSSFESAHGIRLKDSPNTHMSSNTMYNVTAFNASVVPQAHQKASALSGNLKSGYGFFLLNSNGSVITNNELELVEFWASTDETTPYVTYGGNVVDGLPITFVSLDHPTDLLVEEGTLDDTVTWHGVDEASSHYVIYRDGIQIANGVWFSGVPIVQGLADLQLGSYLFQLVLTDTYDRQVSDDVIVTVVESDPPLLVDTPLNITYLENSAGNQLTWTAEDNHPGIYHVYQNDVEVGFGSWDSGVPIQLSIDGLTEGTYNFTIVVLDSSNNMDSYQSYVYVLSNTSIVFSDRPSNNMFFTLGEETPAVLWEISSIEGGNYTITQNGLTVKSGLWVPNVPINITMTSLPLGQYTISLVAVDIFGNIIEDEVTVNVVNPQTTTSSTSSTSHQTGSSLFPIDLSFTGLDEGTILLLLLGVIVVAVATIGAVVARRRRYKSKVYVSKQDKIERLGQLGESYLAMGDIGSAVQNFNRALKGARKVGNKRLEALQLANLGHAGIVLADRSKIGTTKQNLEQALSISRQIKDVQLETKVLGLLGDVSRLDGDPKKAVEYYRKAIDKSQSIDDERAGILLLRKQGEAYESLNDQKKAVQNYGQALVLAKAIQDRKAEGELYRLIGNGQRDIGENKKAFDNYTQAMEIAKRFNNIREQALILADMGLAFFVFGDKKKCINNFQDALNLAISVSDDEIIAYQRGNLGIVHLRSKEFDKAVEYLQEALKFDEIPALLQALGDAQVGLGELNKAKSTYEKGLRNARKANDKPAELELLEKLVVIYEKMGEDEKVTEMKAKADEARKDLADWRKQISSTRFSSRRFATVSSAKDIANMIPDDAFKTKKPSDDAADESSKKEKKK